MAFFVGLSINDIPPQTPRSDDETDETLAGFSPEHKKVIRNWTRYLRNRGLTVTALKNNVEGTAYVDRRSMPP